MATAVTYTVTTSDRGTVDVGCSVCGPLVNAAPLDTKSQSVGRLNAHASLHLAQAGRFGRLMTRDATEAALGRSS